MGFRGETATGGDRTGSGEMEAKKGNCRIDWSEIAAPRSFGQCILQKSVRDRGREEEGTERIRLCTALGEVGGGRVEGAKGGGIVLKVWGKKGSRRGGIGARGKRMGKFKLEEENRTSSGGKEIDSCPTQGRRSQVS